MHAYIGQEADFVITVTTRTKPPAKADASDFVLEPHTVCVALTRAKEAQWLIGNLDYLSGSGKQPDSAMARYITNTLETAPPLEAKKLLSYLDWVAPDAGSGLIRDFRPDYHHQSGILLNYGGSPMIADCAIGQQFGWQPDNPIQQLLNQDQPLTLTPEEFFSACSVKQE